MHHAVIICTYGRPEMLRQTLRSVAAQSFPHPLLVVVVEKNAEVPLNEGSYSFELRHMRYEGPASAARQRNAGVDSLPETVDQVFFLDDDVKLEPGYLSALHAVLDTHPDIGGAGGVLTNEARPASTLWERLFFLAGKHPGSVLPSGHTVSAQFPSASPLTLAQWLSTCSSVYRRSLLERYRFDPRVPGAMREDLDFSYRVGRETRLVVEPRARLHHCISPRNRPQMRTRAAMGAVQRYWFVEKNLHHPLRKAAFWWSVVGQAAARLASRHPAARASLRGLADGVRTIVRRSHPLLQRKGD